MARREKVLFSLMEKKIKTGIVTFQYAYNYGAVLQCLALQRTLDALGDDVSVINFLPPNIHGTPIWQGWGIRNKTFFQQLQKKWLRICLAKDAKSMREVFERFRSEHLMLSEPCTSNEEIASIMEGYDALVAGSDQIWHFFHPPIYFLEWGHEFSGKRISYAPCCGRKNQDMSRVKEITQWLSRFDHLSVRNEVSRELFEGLVGHRIPVVADPTLLTDLSDVQKSVKLPCSEYILTYTLGAEIDKGNRVAIEKIRERVGNLPVVAVVPSAHIPHQAPWADISITTAGPAEWLWLIAHASFVLTDSFHGVLFSMKKSIPFFSYYAEEGRAPRLLDLAERYALDGCIGGSVEEGDRKEWGLSFDHVRTEQLVQSHVDVSIQYLKSALEC